MTNALIVLAPLLLLIIVVLFGFTGCGKLLTDPGPEPPSTQPPSTQPPPADTYGPLVEATNGFTVRWPLNEAPGAPSVAAVPLVTFTGEYKGGAEPGVDGAFHHKTSANRAVKLNGTSAYIEVPFQALLNAGQPLMPGGMNTAEVFSVEVWIKPRTGLLAAQQVVISSHDFAPGGGPRGYEIILIPNGAGTHDVRGVVYSPANPVQPVDVSPGGPDPASWRHIVLTYNGAMGGMNTLALHVNVTGTPGMAMPATRSSPYQPARSPCPLRFGAGRRQADGLAEDFFDGIIDEVAFYNGVLPPASVQQHFQAF